MELWKRVVYYACISAVALAVSACSDSGSGGNSSSTSVMSPASGSIQIDDTSSGQIDLTVTASADLAGRTIVPVVTVDQAVLSVQGNVDASVPNQYVIHMVTAPNLAPGTYSGKINLRLCSDSSCSSEYSGGKSFPYSIAVGLADWTTFQRNASHTGFVNATLDPTKFTKIWSWSRPAGDPEPIGGINSVATGAGKVYVTKDIYFGQGSLYALNEADGSLSWVYDFGRMASEGPPAFANGTVYMPSTDQGESCMTWAIDAALGTYQFKMPSSCQWSSYFAPTVLGGSVLNTSQAGTVYSYSTAGGALQWSAFAGAADQTTPAVDRNYVYQYGASGSEGFLNIFNRTDGSLSASITDPFQSGFSGYSMFSAPILGSLGNVIVFSGGGFSGQAASSSEQYDSRILVSYDIAKKAYSWRSSYAYLTHPALASGIVYAARNSPMSLDALSEADGHILWSWVPPAGNASFHRNIIVTKNLVFVSTDANVYAIDLNTHQHVWQYPKSGMLAISSNLNLYIVTGTRVSDGNLDAIRLK